MHSSTNQTEGDVAKIQDVASTPDQALTAQGSGLQAVRPSDTAPLSADDAGKLPDSVLKPLEAQNRPGGARTVHLPSQQDQEERLRNLESRKTDPGPHPSPGPESVEDRLSTQAPDTQPHQSISQGHKEPLIEPHTPQALKDGPDRAQTSGVLESQLDIAHSDTAMSGSPFTPDVQLRLEEARSLQGHIDDPSPKQSRQTSDTLAAQHMQAREEQERKDVQPAAQTPSGANDPLDTFRRGQPQVQAAPEKSALRNSAFPGFAGDIAKDITFSQRPPMRIDTGLSQMADPVKSASNKRAPESSAGVTYTPPDSATSARPGHTSAQAQSPPERMTTRVSSGALRHKSVSEILGETPKQ